MKKLVVSLVVVVFVFVGYVVAGPYLTMSSIKSNIESKDDVMLAQDIDFVRLRQNLKDQLNVKMAEHFSKSSGNDAAAAIGAMFGPAMVDRLVDAYVTPAGLSKVLSGKDPADGVGEVQPVEIEASRYEFDSMSMFSVYVTGENDAVIRVILERDGLGWKLTNMVLPEEFSS